jgi:hypothetical protein
MGLVRHLLAAAYVEHRRELANRVMHHHAAGKVKNTRLRQNSI